MDVGDRVREIMQGFAARTGLEPEAGAPRRYLWTDAFAVCNFLGLSQREAGDESLRIALRLVDQVHRTLGRHRPDDARKGWISGLDEEQGARHPTAGGLRIGKDLPERRVGEPYDAVLEWERDGPYLHYLTRWMHALDRVARATGDSKYALWARELGKRAFSSFVVTDAGGTPRGLYWKMSIDLSRPLVPSMGQHDPLDGFLVCARLQSASQAAKICNLEREVRALREICRGRRWETDDALGIGGLLTDAHALAGMIVDGILDEVRLLESLLEACRSGLEILRRIRFLDAPAESRLPFRELGLTIGLRALPDLQARIARARGAFESFDRLDAALDALAAYRPWVSRVEQFWLDPVNRREPNWVGHREINEVMLATSLAPAGYLGIADPRPSVPK